MTQKISSTNIETSTLILLNGPSIANVSIANSTYVLLDDTAVSNAGGFAVITGTNFVSGAQVLFGNTAAPSVTFVDSTRLNVQVPALTAGSYVMYIQNPDGSTAIKLNAITSSPIPVWVTGSTLTSQTANVPISISLSAPSDSNVTFSVANGSSLPAGTTLAANGLFSGTVSISTETTYNFSVNAIDAENQEALRSFSVTVQVGDPYFNLTTLLLPGDGTNNANNNVFRDSSNNNFAITRNGNPTQGTFSPLSQTGWSNYFDGVSRLDFPTTSTYQLGSSDFTYETWVYVTASGFNPTIYWNANSSGYAALAVRINSATGNPVRLSFSTSGSSWVTDTDYGTTNLNTWNHIAVVRSGNNIKLYLNGIDITSGGIAVSGSLMTTYTKNELAAYNSTSYRLTGYLSNTRLVIGAALYTANFTPSTSPLTKTSQGATAAQTEILTCQSNRFVDNSDNGAAITVNGTPSVQAFSPFAPTDAYSAATVGGSGFFDGTGDSLTLPTSINSSIGALAGKQLTFEFWINTSEIAAVTAFNMGLFGNFVATSANGRYGIFLFGSSTTSPQTVSFGYTTSVSTTASVTTTAQLNQKSWNHVAITINATTASSTTIVIYINGVGQTFTAQNLSSQTSDPGINFVLGETRDGNQLFRGYMGGFKISSGIQRSSNFTPPTTPFTLDANTILLLNYQNAGITDATAKNVLESVGDAKISTAQSKFGGSSMYFDGTGDSLATAPSQLFNLGASDFTIEFWIYPANFSAVVYPLYSTSARAKTDVLALEMGTGGTIVLYATASGGGAWSIASAATIGTLTVSAWNHVALVRNGSSFRGYVNGVQSASLATSSSALASFDGFNIGTNGAGSGFVNGYIDDFRITRFARYTAGFTPPTSAFLTR